jgi:hypothetical protein
MADLYSVTPQGMTSQFGANAQKATHDTFNYGTPRIYPLVFIRNDEGDWTGYASSGSDFFKVINYLQGRGVEIYGIGEVSGSQFSIFVNWEKTPKDDGDDQEPNANDDIDLFEDEISTLLSIGVNIEYGKIIGGALSNDC